MALKQPITQPSGYDATYWRLTDIDIDWQNSQAQVTLKGYKDEQARRDNPRRAVMDEKRYAIAGDFFGKFFAVPDLSQVPAFDPSVAYNAGALVKTEKRVYEAVDDVPANNGHPSESDKWKVEADLRLNRTLAYTHIKQSADEFATAEDV
jgi:hypothetical protein